MRSHFQATTEVAEPGYMSSSPFGVSVEVSNILEGTEEFRSLGAERRECLFPREKTLAHFPLYSEGNCYLECVWEEARRECGCVPWFLTRHFPGTYSKH